MAQPNKAKTRSGRTVLGRQASPRTNAAPGNIAGQSSAGHSNSPTASSVRPSVLEKDRRPRQSLLWTLLFLAAAALHAVAARQVYQYLTATCEGATSKTRIQEDQQSQAAVGEGGTNLPPPPAVTGPRDDVPKFFLYRVIGNNMPPLQCPSQLLWNTQYALAYEGDLPGCKKRWVVNKIVNSTERALVVQSLIDAGYTTDDILIRWFNATKVALSPRDRWLDLVTQQNEARNLAIEDGVRSGATWILPFDGNHFITRESWESIQASAKKAEEHGLKYFKVPVHRLYREQTPSWVKADSKFSDIKRHAPVMIESQLAFRYDAPERFQHSMVYGMQNKLEALSRICGDGTEPSEKQRCWCNDLGKEGQSHPSSEAIARECGYSLRLWFYPCPGVEPLKVLKNGMYRKKLRTDSRRQMTAWIKKEAQNAMKQMHAKEEIRKQQLLQRG